MRACAQSLRWFRFQCCGFAFPCDDCHFTAQKDNPACVEGSGRAHRMICGMCCFEQPFAVSRPCRMCGAALGPAKGKVHWEGGKGQRNQTIMSKKDKKKFSGGAKTVSNKAKSKA